MGMGGGGNQLSRKQPAGKKPSPLSTLANGSVCLGLVSSLGLGEWWKWKSSESQIQGRGSRNKLACPHVHNQQLPGCAGAVGLRGLGHGHDQTALHQHREEFGSMGRVVWITTPLFICSSLVQN